VIQVAVLLRAKNCVCSLAVITCNKRLKHSVSQVCAPTAFKAGKGINYSYSNIQLNYSTALYVFLKEAEDLHIMACSTLPEDVGIKLSKLLCFSHCCFFGISVY
jgi:hypothetical protein